MSLPPMNPPESVNDPSLLRQEPLCTHIAILEALEGNTRSHDRNVISRFVDAMQQNDKAAEATKQWAYLVFEDVLSDKDSFDVTDGGEKLYEVFFEYQIRLSRGLQHGNDDEACQYKDRVFRQGISAIKLKDRGANAQHSTGGRGGGGKSKGHASQPSSRPHKMSGPKDVRHQVGTSVQRPDAGLTRFTVMEATRLDLTESTGSVVMNSNTECGSHSTMGSSANDVPLAIGAPLSILPGVAKSSKRSKSKKEKKRKANSQKPPIITHSDASEDDKEPSKTRVVTAANITPHRSKRFAPSPCSQPYNLPGPKDQVDEKSSAHGPQTDTSISQLQSTLASIRSDEFISFSSIKGGRGAGLPLNGLKHVKRRIMKHPSQPTRASSIPLRKTRLDLQTRTTKRLRRASISTPDCELGEGSKSTGTSRTRVVQESTIQVPLVTGPPLGQECIRAESEARRKRTRIEFETGFVVSHDKASADSHEPLGPDSRLLRPLPKKVRDRRLVLVADEDTARRGVPCGAPSLKHAEHLLRDVTSNALAILREEAGPDVPDWTQDEGHDSECEDLYGHDQDEASDVHVSTATSPPSTVIPKPPVPAPPRIWAQSRQEVCESFEYFRSYHSGVYSKNDIVKGYLLGAYAASRDIFHHGGRLIISHGGGKSEAILDPRRGPKRYQTDQDQEASDKSVRALLKTCKDRRPIALLADDKYALFPYDLTSANYTYVVLGFYWISHAWAECQPARDGSGRIVRWKFAFQWCEGQGDPWWTPQQKMTDIASGPPKPISDSRMCPTKGSPHPANSGGDPSIQCKHCQEQSPFVYKQGWMCLNPRCSVFWDIDNEDPKQLDYRDEFLSLLPKKFERLPNLTPARVAETPGGVTTTYAFSKGWHCTKCGRLSCRYKWEHWECPNCEFKYVVQGRIRSPKEFWHQRPPKGFLHSQIGKDSGILAARPEPINLGAHRGFTNCLTFVLPHSRGKIHLIIGTPLSNGDADNIFQLYQQRASTGDLQLRRYPLRNHRARGLLLTNYFSQNSGEPYQYVGGSEYTVPLHEAPDCVQRALALIKERANLALRIDIPFNEVLSAAYMERQKMSFHSDSEKGLGPTVASLSLGSAALMHFRPHVNMENPKGNGAYALTLVLRHGDVLIMEGSGVQQYYEHTVVPMNFRIAATARCIGSA